MCSRRRELALAIALFMLFVTWGIGPDNCEALARSPCRNVLIDWIHWSVDGGSALLIFPSHPAQLGEYRLLPAVSVLDQPCCSALRSSAGFRSALA